MISTPYDRIADAFAGARIRLRPKEVEYLSALLASLSSSGTILDLGCGTGHPIASWLAARGHQIVGVDGSSAMLALARQRLPGHRWIHALMEDLQLDEAFDAVVCWDSLFHLPRHNHPGVIRTIYRSLKPGCRVMVSSGGVVEGEDGITGPMFGQVFWYDSLPPEGMMAVMEDTGFKLVISEMSDQPDGETNRGKWAIVAER